MSTMFEFVDRDDHFDELERGEMHENEDFEVGGTQE